MKLVLFAALLLAGTTGYLLWHHQGLPDVNLPFAVSQRDASTPPQAAAPNPKPPVRRPTLAAKPDVDPPSDATTEQPILPQPAPATPRPRVNRPFPLPNQVTEGEGEESITSKYGNPSAWVVSSNDGHVIETLVYTQERGSSSTVIRCVDGIVSAAYAKVLPSSPAGSLVRDFELQN